METCPKIHKFFDSGWFQHLQSQINYNNFPINYIYSTLLSHTDFEKKLSSDGKDIQFLRWLQAYVKNHPMFQKDYSLEIYFLLKYHIRHFTIPKFELNFCIYKNHYAQWYIEKKRHLNNSDFCKRYRVMKPKKRKWYKVVQEIFQVGSVLFEIVLNKEDETKFFDIISAFILYYKVIIRFSIKFYWKQLPRGFVSNRVDYLTTNLIHYGYAILCLLSSQYIENWVQNQGGWNCVKNAAKFPATLYTIARETALNVYRSVDSHLPPGLKHPLLKFKLRNEIENNTRLEAHLDIDMFFMLKRKYNIWYDDTLEDMRVLYYIDIRHFISFILDQDEILEHDRFMEIAKSNLYTAIHNYNPNLDRSTMNYLLKKGLKYVKNITF